MNINGTHAEATRYVVISIDARAMGTGGWKWWRVGGHTFMFVTFDVFHLLISQSKPET